MNQHLTSTEETALWNLTVAQRRALAALIVRFAIQQVTIWKDGAALTVSQAEEIAARFSSASRNWAVHVTPRDLDVARLTVHTWDAHPLHKGQLATLERAWTTIWRGAPDVPVDSQGEAVAKIRALMNPKPQAPPPADEPVTVKKGQPWSGVKISPPVQPQETVLGHVPGAGMVRVPKAALADPQAIPEPHANHHAVQDAVTWEAEHPNKDPDMATVKDLMNRRGWTWLINAVHSSRKD